MLRQVVTYERLKDIQIWSVVSRSVLMELRLQVEVLMAQCYYGMCHKENKQGFALPEPEFSNHGSDRITDDTGNVRNRVS